MWNGEVMFGLLFLAIGLGLLVTFVVRKFAKGSSHERGASPLRNFFQFGVLYALIIIVANGVAGLLGRLMSSSALVIADNASLARNLSFVVVGVPLLVGIGFWTRKGMRSDPRSADDPIIAFFVLVSTMTALLMALTSTTSCLHNLVSTQPFNGQTLANAIVWTLIWIGLWRLHRIIVSPAKSHTHHLAGSLVGYIASVLGLVSVIAHVIAQFAGMNNAALVATQTVELKYAIISFAVGALVWMHYWVRVASKETRTTLWLAYVLLVGVGSGLVMAVASASTTLYTVAVWFIGEPHSTIARAHFASTPSALGVIVVGLIGWWYHSSLVSGTVKRTEIDRTYAYLIAGISLIASALGLSMILIAIIEAAFTRDVIVGGSIVNSFLASATLILVGSPLWVTYWRRIQQHVKADEPVELASPSRRVYLFLLFGIGGIAAMVSLLAGVFQLFNDAFNSGIGGNTIRDMRYSIGVLVSTAIVAAYHWSIYRHENTVDVAFGTKQKTVLLVGPHDADLAHSVAQQTGARITSWSRTDLGDVTWPEHDVVKAILESTSQQLIVILGATGLEVIPVVRD